ncbi:MAG TPA: porin [Gallionella sp.]|nr:porin [Gallionella sp.]
MQKKIIALAIAAAVSAPAFADNSNVTVYGVANVSYDMTNTGGVAGFSNNKVSSNTSRLGFKGNEDLGDGLSAIWQIESLIQIDGTAGAAGNGLATRNTFAGLSSATAGTVLLGRHDTPYNISNRKYDLFTDTLADNRSIMGGGVKAAASFNGRQPNVVAYISPAMSGFTGAIAYVAGAEGQTLSTQTKGNAWSLAALYGNGPISANFAYEAHNAGSAPGTLGLGAGLKETAWTISGGYKVEAFEVNGVYEKTSDNFAAGANLNGHRAYYLSGKYNFGSNAVKLAYSNAGNTAAASTGASQVTVGLDHSLSKRTTVYALYTQLSNNAGVAYGLSTNGTGAPAAGITGNGAKPSAFSFGMKHTF